MILEELLRRLAIGPLSNIALGGSGAGIPDAKIPQVVAYINEGLREIYSRFPIKEKSLALRLSEGKVRYRLVETNATTRDAEGGFILDTEENRFNGDVLKVLTASDGSGNRLPLNDRDSSLAIFTPEPDMVLIPHPIADQIIYIVYQALPEEIFTEDLDQTIPITRLLEDALIAYVAHCAYRDMNTEVSMLSAQQHLSRFELRCSTTNENDLVNAENYGGGQKFYDRGFL